MDQQWYYVRQGEQQGPISAQELVNLYCKGTVADDSAVWTEGMQGWCAFGSTELVEVAQRVGGLAPAGKRRKTEVRPTSRHTLPEDFSTWIPGLGEPALMRLFNDALLFYRPHVIAGMPGVRDQLLASFVQRFPDVEDRNPGSYSFSDAFLLDCVDDFASRLQLWEVLGKGNDAAVAAIITSAARLDERYLGQVYALHMLGRAQAAIDAGDEGALLGLLEEDAGLAGVQDLQGRSVWHRLASGSGGEKSVQLLQALLSKVEEPARYIDLTDRAGNSALHAAAEAQQVEVARLLLRAGADPGLQNRDSSKYALGDWSIKVKDLDFAIPVPSEHQTPLHIAAEHGSAELLQLLLEHGARPGLELRDSGGATPLHLALEAQEEEAVRALLAAGAEPAASMGDSSTPLHFCCSCGRADLAELLLATGKVDVNQPGPQGWLPLHLAARRGNAKTVRLLLQHGADLQAVCQEKTSLEIARINNRTACVEALEQAAAAAAGRQTTAVMAGDTQG